MYCFQNIIFHITFLFQVNIWLIFLSIMLLANFRQHAKRRILRCQTRRGEIQSVCVRGEKSLLVPNVYRRPAHLGRSWRGEGQQLLHLDAQKIRDRLQRQTNNRRQLNFGGQGAFNAHNQAVLHLRGYLEENRYQVRGPFRQISRPQFLPAQSESPISHPVLC